MTQVASSTMKADPTAATRALLALAQAQWESDRARADDKRRAAVLAARAAGMSDQAIADAMGLSRPRVQQIKWDTPNNCYLR